MSRLLLGLAVVTGCASLHDRAEAAYARGDYMQAASLYDEAGLVARRAEAREQTLRQLIYRAQAARTSGQLGRAADDVAQLFTARDRWAIAVPADVAPALAIEIAATGDHVVTLAHRAIATAGPLRPPASSPHARTCRRSISSRTTRSARSRAG